MYFYRRQMNFLLVLLLLAAVVYGGIKGWMYYNVHQAMSELSVAAAGRADISYDGIDTELKGAVTVRGITVLPIGAPQPVRIDGLRLSGPRLDFFLWGNKSGDRQTPPDHLRVSMDGISIDLDPALISALRDNLPGDEEHQTSRSGCSLSDDLDPELLQELGFKQLLMDVSLAYDYDKSARSLSAEVELDIRQLERLQARLSLGDVAPDALQGGMSAIPTLAGMSLDMRVEPEFGRRYLAACAKRNGQEPEAFRAALVKETQANMARAGLQLGVGLTQALQDYHQHWGDLSISAEPASPVNLMGLMFSPPQNWQRTLGIRVKVNQREVSDLSFDMRPPSAEELAVLMGKEPPPSEPRKPRPRYRKVYRTVPVARLADQLGAEVRVYLRDDQPVRNGILSALTNTEAHVEQRSHGGKITALVPLTDILRVEVLTVEQIPEGKK